MGTVGQQRAVKSPYRKRQACGKFPCFHRQQRRMYVSAGYLREVFRSFSGGLQTIPGVGRHMPQSWSHRSKASGPGQTRNRDRSKFQRRSDVPYQEGPGLRCITGRNQPCRLVVAYHYRLHEYDRSFGLGKRGP